MAVTKTNFINFARCQRYVALDEIKKETLKATMSIAEYKDEERLEKIKEIMCKAGDQESEDDNEQLEEIVESMLDENGNVIIDKVNPQLEAMLDYYKEVELQAGSFIENKFDAKAKYSINTHNQEKFECLINDINYLCFVDIYLPKEDAFNIFEVKATTSGGFIKMGTSESSIFEMDETGIYRLKHEMDIDDIDPKKYSKQLAHLYNKYHNCGKYVYDLAVQRYIIEQSLIIRNETSKIDKIKYYLVTLNSKYVFDGKYKNNKPDYQKDENGNELISIFDFTEVTKNYMDKIEIDRKNIEEYINKKDMNEVPLGIQCCRKKTTECKYKPVCFSKLPKQNSIFSYFFNHCGFQDEYKNKYETYDLINDGTLSMLDVNHRILNRESNRIQREVIETHKPYINKEKMILALNEIRYPIYHLDFETFNSPLPRFKGEKCYTQSVFQFSLHIEKEPGICDKEKDHFEFLAKDHTDQREELIKKLCEYIDITSGGTILAYNVAFEKSRLKELSKLFPEYKLKLDKMIAMTYDLMWVVKNHTELYEELGYGEEEAKRLNYYHEDLDGSYSIKKVLPVFSELTYKGMPVGNGTEAILAYSRFQSLSKEEFNKTYNDLLKYCCQDTWAMVEILNELRKLCKSDGEIK